MRLCIRNGLVYISSLGIFMKPMYQNHNYRAAATLLAAGLFAAATGCPAAAPKGLILNLDLQNIEDGLIPNKALYALDVPLGDLETGRSLNDRIVLMISKGEHLDIPHSSLLDPDGSGWVASIRVYALTEGLILSQSDGERGYALYMQDGAIHAAIQTGHSTLYLREHPDNGITPCLNNWVTIELIITSETALLVLNRAHVAWIPLEEPLHGKHARIRIGHHDVLPAPLARNQTLSPDGFTGAVRSLKILRQ